MSVIDDMWLPGDVVFVPFNNCYVIALIISVSVPSVSLQRITTLTSDGMIEKVIFATPIFSTWIKII
jgi:hypothetical protein